MDMNTFEESAGKRVSQFEDEKRLQKIKAKYEEQMELRKEYGLSEDEDDGYSSGCSSRGRARSGTIMEDEQFDPGDGSPVRSRTRTDGDGDDFNLEDFVGRARSRTGGDEDAFDQEPTLARSRTRTGGDDDEFTDAHGLAGQCRSSSYRGGKMDGFDEGDPPEIGGRCCARSGALDADGLHAGGRRRANTDRGDLDSTGDGSVPFGCDAREGRSDFRCYSGNSSDDDAPPVGRRRRANTHRGEMNEDDSVQVGGRRRANTDRGEMNGFGDNATDCCGSGQDASCESALAVGYIPEQT